MLKGLVKVMCASLALAGGWVCGEVTLNGAGASFPAPLYNKMIQDYSRIAPDAKINYSSVGSGAGINKISEQTVDFGASDSPMTDDQMSKAQGGKLYHIPTALGAVVPIYNVEGLDNLRFSGPVLADIFMGNITNWSDPKIAQLNQGVTLPDAAITIVHRSDGSGTTAIFTSYLCKVSPAFKEKIGTGTTVKWVGQEIGGKGNEQVAANVQRTKNSIGYVELIYAEANKIKFAPVQNKAGKFVAASLESTSAAAGDLSNAPADLRMNITDAAGDNAYPIAGMTWLLIYENQKDAPKGKAMVDFAWWVTHDGQAINPTLHYAPLPKELVGKIEGMLNSIKADGKALKSK